MWFSVYLRSPAFGARIASSLIPQSGSNLWLVFPPRADAVSQRYRLTDICQSVRGWQPQRNVFLKKKKIAIVQTFSWLHTVKTTYNSIHQENMLCYLCGSGTQVPSCWCAKNETTLFLSNNCFISFLTMKIKACWHVSAMSYKRTQWWRSPQCNKHIVAFFASKTTIVIL